MASIRDVAAYFCKHYPYPEELSKARLTKLVYLADWRSAIDNKSQLTRIEWFYNNYGPYVSDVVDEARQDRSFRVESTWNAFGANKDLVSLRDPKNVDYPTLSRDDKEVLDEVIAATKGMTFNEFIEFVYGTYPVQTQERYSRLDLLSLAREYRRSKRLS
jgi:hypothetical protein